ncbi:MAG: hypothetical protein JWO69_1450, partial [Thermoleophilia bacterium]|nr:hypothetical protein [Thermoleophilia bacterium]
GGRWYIGGQAIRTDWEPKPAAPLTISGTTPAASSGSTARPPRITRLRMPLRVRTPRVTVRVAGRAMGSSRIRYVRFQVGPSRYTAWLPTRSSYTLRLPSGTSARYRVRVQLRNAAGQNSRIAQRYVRCACE